MRTIGLGMGLLAVLALTSSASANLVTNGDFSGGYYVDQGYKCPNDWSWYPQYPGTTVTGRVYEGADLGPGGVGDTCWRLRIVSNSIGRSVMYQVIDTVPGETYTIEAQWMATTTKPTTNCNLAWSGTFFFDGGTPGDTVGNRALIDAFVPDAGSDTPHRYSNGGYDPPETSPPTERILPPNQEIVAEHVEDYGLLNWVDMPFNHWDTIYNSAGGAGEPSMPGIGESEANGGGAAWQTKVATGNHMIVGFFTLDTPSTNGGGSDLYVDNVVVTPEPVTVVLLALGVLAMWRRR